MSFPTLISFIESLNEAGYGINLLEQDPPAVVLGDTDLTVGLTASFSWGPTSVETVTSLEEFMALYMPRQIVQHPNASIGVSKLPAGVVTNEGLSNLALFNKNFAAPVKFVNILGTSPAQSALVMDDVTGTPIQAFLVTAAYNGGLGDWIRVTTAVNTDTDYSDVTISFGTEDIVLEKLVYKDGSNDLVIGSDWVMGGGVTYDVVSSDGRPVCTFSIETPAALLPAVIASVALSGGTKGTLAAGDFVGSEVSPTGAFQFADDAPRILALVEVPDSLIEGATGVNALLGLLSDAVPFTNTFILGSTPAAATSAELVTHAGDVNHERVGVWAPLVRAVDTSAATPSVLTLDGNLFIAAQLTQIYQEESPGGPRHAPLFSGIVGTEEAVVFTPTTRKTLRNAGINTWVYESSSAYSFGGNSTLQNNTAGKDRIYRRRMADLIYAGLIEAFVPVADAPLTVKIASREISGEAQEAYTAAYAFLFGLSTDVLPDKGRTRIQSFSMDPFIANTQAGIDSGSWLIKVSVKLWSSAEAITLIAQVGTTVE